MDLNELRLEIDKIDEQLIKLFEERMETSKRVAKFKKLHNIPIFDPKRELEILTNLTAKVKKERKAAVKALYMLLFELSRSEQENV